MTTRIYALTAEQVALAVSIVAEHAIEPHDDPKGFWHGNLVGYVRHDEDSWRLDYRADGRQGVPGIIVYEGESEVADKALTKIGHLYLLYTTEAV